MDYDKIPALAPPEGVVPNFEDPPNRNAIAYATISITVVLSTFAIILRMCSRRFVIHKILLRDVILLLAYIFWMATLALTYKWVVDTGFFVHQWNVNILGFIELQHTYFQSIIMFCIFMAFVKTAILLEWRHIFCVPAGTRNPLYWVIMTVMTVNLLFYTSMVIVQSTACSPHAYIWDRRIPGGVCWANWYITDITSAVINFVTDLCILAIPQRIIWSLNMPRHKKKGIAVLFAIGLFGVVAAGCRVGLTVLDLFIDDNSFKMSWVVLCCFAEGLCAILVVCGPTIPKTLDTMVSSTSSSWLRSLGSSKKSSSASSSSSNNWDSGKRSNTIFNTPTWKNDSFNIGGVGAKPHYIDIENQRKHPSDEIQLGPFPKTPSPVRRPLDSGRGEKLSQADLDIMRTTEFQVAEGRRRSSEDAQHPWMGRPGRAL